MVWNEYRTGTQLTVIGTEHTIAGTGDAQDLPVGSLYVFFVDLTNMLAADTVEIRVYTKIQAAGTLKQYDVATFSGVQASPGVQSIPVVGSSGVRFTIKQTTGSARSLQWSVGRAP